MPLNYLTVTAQKEEATRITDDLVRSIGLAIAKLDDGMNFFNPDDYYMDCLFVDGGTESTIASTTGTHNIKAVNGLLGGYANSFVDFIEDADLRHYWPFSLNGDDEAGSLDLSTPSDQYGVGTSGYAIQSASGNKYAETTSFTGFADAAAWSIAFQYKANAGASGETIFQIKDDSLVENIECVINANDITINYTDPSNVEQWSVTVSVTHGTTNFHQVLLTHATNGTVTLHVDGLTVNTDVVGATYDYALLDRLNIMSQAAASQPNKADVDIDEFAIFTTTKDATYQAAVYNSGSFRRYQYYDYTDVLLEDASCISWMRFDGDMVDRKFRFFDDVNSADAGALSYTTGMFTGNQSFEGAADVGRLLTTPTALPGGAMTISFWFQRDPGIAGDEYIYTISNMAQGLQFYLDSSMRMNVGSDEPAGGAFSIQTSAISTNVWHHCALVYNGTTGYTLYIDGVSAGTDTTDGTEDYSDYVAAILGANYTGSWSNNFEGNIDELGFFTEAKDLTWMEQAYGIEDGDTQITDARRYEVLKAADVVTGMVDIDHTTVDAVRIHALVVGLEGNAKVDCELNYTGPGEDTFPTNVFFELAPDDMSGVLNSVLTFKVTPTTKGEPTQYYPTLAGFALEAIVSDTSVAFSA